MRALVTESGLRVRTVEAKSRLHAFANEDDLYLMLKAVNPIAARAAEKEGPKAEEEFMADFVNKYREFIANRPGGEVLKLP